MIRAATAILAAALLFSAAGCSEKSKGESQSAKPPVAVDSVRATAGTFTESVEVVGTLSPKFSADVKADYPGTVQEILVAEWVPVRKGQALAKLDAREFKAALLQAQAAAARADREFERAKQLKAVGLMTEQGLQDSETILDEARAGLEMAKVRVDKTVVRAPMDGVIAQRAVSEGDRAGDNILFRVVDNRLFDLKVTVPSGKIASVKVGQPLSFTTEALPEKTFEGKVAFINPAADPASRAVQVVAEVPNPRGDLRADLFVKGRIITGTRDQVLQVPKGALLAWNVETGKAECFVLAGDRAARRAVTTGAIQGEVVEVTSGLRAGDAIVTRGAFNLAEGDRVLLAGGQKDGDKGTK
jgi:membrane fusion protein, multidrug efflux system